MNAPLRISIVTPSFNQGLFLEETIRSVLGQEYPDLEYIVIDGGSKDNSVEIIQKYSSRLAYWVSEPDRGQSHAINKGFERCTGDIMAWINSDDLYVPGVFQFIADYFQQHPEVDLVYGDAEIINESGKFLMHRKELPTDVAMGNMIGWGFLIPQPAAFWRRRVFEKVGLLDERLHFAMDYDYWQRISEIFTLKHVPILIARQRYHMSAKTLNFQKQPSFQNEIEILRERGFSRLGISKMCPYSLALVLRNIYRLKRIAARAIKGHYTTGYIPDPILRRLVNKKWHAE